MNRKIKKEIAEHVEIFKSLDSKTVIVFLSSIILLVFSWYFANPEFFEEFLVFKSEYTPITQELISYIFWFLTDFLIFLIIPVNIIKLIFHENLSEYGIRFGETKVGIILTIISIILFLPILFIVSGSEYFSQYYPLMQSAKSDLFVFLIYEVGFILFIFSWEFIFRGFILFGLEKKFGIYAIFIQMIPFVLLHSGKPFIETFTSIFGGLFLGYLALKTRSVFYGFFIHATILIILDILAIV